MQSKMPPCKNAKVRRLGICRASSAIFLFLAVCSGSALAATRTWTGGTSALWNNYLNWDASSATPPASGDSLVFSSSPMLTGSNNLAVDTSFAALTFDSGASAYTLSGNRILTATTSTITNNSASLQTINFDVKVIGSTAQSLLINTASGDVVFNGNFVAGTTLNSVYTIVKSGTGTLTMNGTGSATYTGAWVKSGVLGLGASNVVGGILQVDANNGVAFNAGIGNFSIGNLGGSGSIRLEDTAANAISLTIAKAASSPVYSGHLSGAGSLIVNKTVDNGGTFLTGSSSYSGGTQVLNGKLAVRNANALGTGALSIGAGGDVLIGANVNVPGLSGSAGAVIEADNGVAGTRTLTVNTPGTNNHYAGLFKDGTGSNVLALTKSGTGTLVLANTGNTYTGATMVNGGTLLVNGSIVSSSGVSVAAGAALGGYGRVSTVSGAGTVTPGEGAGILTANSIDPASGLHFAFQFTEAATDGLSIPVYGSANASGNDLLRLTGATPFAFALSADNQITLDFTGMTLNVGDVYAGGFFVDGATDFLDSVENASLVYLGVGSGLSLQLSTTATTVDFGSGGIGGYVTQFTVVPEAKSWTMLLLGGGLLAAVSRRGFRAGKRYRLT